MSLCLYRIIYICISMGGQLDGNFLPGSLPHKFILFVTLTICFVVTYSLKINCLLFWSPLYTVTSQTIYRGWRSESAFFSSHFFTRDFVHFCTAGSHVLRWGSTALTTPAWAVTATCLLAACATAAGAVHRQTGYVKRCSQLWLRCDCDKTCQSPCDVIMSSYFHLLTSISYVVQVS